MPKGEKDKLSAKDKTEILSKKGKQSAPYVAKQYGVSHTMIYKIWKRNQMKPTMIDVTIIQKLFGFFSNPLVRQSIPENTKQMFMVSLTDEEKNRIKIILGESK